MGYMHLNEHMPLSRNTPTRLHVCLFIVGVLIGFLITTYQLTTTQETFNFKDYTDISHLSQNVGETKTYVSAEPFANNIYEDSTIANRLFNKVRITCFVMTTPSFVKANGQHLIKTWGHRCNRILFMSSADDSSVPQTVAVKGKPQEWLATKNAFSYLYRHHRQDTDFFMCVDEHSFAILENARFMLQSYQPEMPLYFSSHHNIRNATASSKPTVVEKDYILSKGSIQEIVEFGLFGKQKCHGKDKERSNKELLKCMVTLNILQGESRDSQGRERYLTFEFSKDLPENGPIGEKTDIWFRKHLFKETATAFTGCSDKPISFQNLQINQMYVVNALIYTIQPYGIVDQFVESPEDQQTLIELIAVPNSTNTTKASHN